MGGFASKAWREIKKGAKDLGKMQTGEWAKKEGGKAGDKIRGYEKRKKAEEKAKQAGRESDALERGGKATADTSLIASRRGMASTKKVKKSLLSSKENLG